MYCPVPLDWLAALKPICNSIRRDWNTCILPGVSDMHGSPDTQCIATRVNSVIPWFESLALAKWPALLHAVLSAVPRCHAVFQSVHCSHCLSFFSWVLQLFHVFCIKDWSDLIYMGAVENLVSVGPMTTFNDLSKQKFHRSFRPMSFKSWWDRLHCEHNLKQTLWKLLGFYQTKAEFWPDFADIKYDHAV